MRSGLATMFVVRVGLCQALAALTIGANLRAQAMPEGIDVAVSVVADSLADLSGGQRRGGAILGKADVAVSFDGAAWGLDGLSAFVDVEQTSGGDFSGRFVGDAQGVSNIDGLPGFALYQAYIEKSFDDATALKAGIVDLNTEFDVQDIGVTFLNGSFGIGPEFSHTGTLGPSVFPAVGFGARVSSQIVGGTFKLGIFDALPRDPVHPLSPHLPWSGRDGALFVAETQWDVARIRLKIGAWFYSAKQADLSVGASERYGNRGIYGSASARLLGEESGDEPSLDAWVRMGTSRATFDPVAGYVGGGFVYTGAFDARPQDQIGLAVAAAFFGDPTRQASTPPLSSAETTIEFTYAAPVTGWLVVQPDVQYVIAAGGGNPNALVGGIRLSLSLAPDDLL